MYKIRSIIFSKNIYNFTKCKIITTDNHIKIGRIDITKNYHRFRQLEPSYLLQNKYIIIKQHK